MPELPTPADADLLAQKAHSGQVDKLGVPYIDHPRTVARMVAGLGDSAVMAALLHDAVEDSPLTLDDLRDAGYPDEVVSAIDAVSKRPGEPYMHMIRRALADPLGRTIKLADMAHNMSRNHLLPDDDAAWLRRKYQPAWPLLVEGGPWWAMADDVIGGWCVMPAPLPPSSGIAAAASFISEVTARRIADLHNRDLAEQAGGRD